MKYKKPVAIVYKKSLFVQLVRFDHNFLYSARNRENPRYQVYMFEPTERLYRDIAALNGQKYVKKTEI